MSEHEWCRDVPRDEAVRAAEDAAAVPAIMHRDLPDAVAELRERVARLEAVKAADAGRPEPPDSDEAIAYGATLDALAAARESLAAANRGITRLTAERDAAREEAERLGDRVVSAELACLSALDRVAELEAAPSEPRGWLTEEDRRAVAFAAKAFRGHTIIGPLKENADQLDALLARSTPPRVKVPPAARGETPLVRDLMWGQAIRAAGGEVE